MSFADQGFHDTIALLADPGTGILWANASQLALRLNKTRKLIQKYLCRLERKGYIKRFAVARSHDRYAILVNQYHCTLLPQRGKVLNAVKTTDWRAPVYEAVSRAVSRAVSTPYGTRARVENLENLEKTPKSKPAPRGAAPTPPAPPLKPATPTNPAYETEQRRKIEARDRREKSELEVSREARIGTGPGVNLATVVGVSCLECRAELSTLQLNRCLSGKGPRGSQTYCPRNPPPAAKAAAAGGTISRGAKEFA